ncbi:aKG-HExxH-type peptide beta-hydroxylase [Winogradskyella tangerina]|uniref:aKG-HExxH-type peptide beta-hydroxylase n=1 Tax=Winogradskyella tangerina TaxID=2023240 RepID=UPI000DBE0E28|nr:HEXXH motif-containing putative peptide modification protein [Winogradskyella tangerina]
MQNYFATPGIEFEKSIKKFHNQLEKEVFFLNELPENNIFKEHLFRIIQICQRDKNHLSNWHPKIELDVLSFEALRDEYRFDIIEIAKNKILDSTALIREVEPDFAFWISSAIHKLVILLKPPSIMESSSLSIKPGEVHISLLVSKVALCEMLIHESSHQHFYKFLAKAKLVRENAPDAYSSVKNTKRPLILVLLAFHAFSNVLIFYNKFFLKINDKKLLEQANAIYNQTKKDVISLTESLIQNRTHLTPDGDFLFKELLKKLEFDK